MATARYVALTPIRHNGKLFAVGDPLALTDAQATSLGGAVAPQAGALPAMPPDPPVPVFAIPSDQGIETPASLGRYTLMPLGSGDMASYGDSYAAGIVNLTAPYRIAGAESSLVWLNALAGAPFNLVSRGVGGETSAQILARIDTVLESNVCIFAGTNDINNSSAVGNVSDIVSEFVANVTKILDTFERRGKRIAVATVAPRGTTGGTSAAGWSGNQLKMQSEINRWIRAECARRRLLVVEQFAVLVDPASAGAAPKANVLRDGIHLSNIGGMLVAAYNSQNFTAYFGTGWNKISVSAIDNYANQTLALNGKNILLSPDLTLGTGGLATPGTGTINGQIPQNWRIYISAGSPTVTASIVDIGDVNDPALSAGKAVKLVITGATAGTNVQFYPQNGETASRVETGKYISAIGDVLVEDAVAMLPPRLKAEWQYTAPPASGLSTQRSVVGESGAGATLYSYTSKRKFRLKSPPVLVEAGSLNTNVASWAMNFLFDGAGSATVYISCPELIVSNI